MSDQDLLAEKMKAILKGGNKQDFIEIAQLLERFTIDQFIEYHQLKYPNRMMNISYPLALTYFNHADESEHPVSLKGQTWESVKKTISQKVSDYLK